MRAGIIDWLNWLKDYIGFESWRFDFVKGYAPKYTAEYIKCTCGHDSFCVGEDFSNLCWNDGHLAYVQNDARQKLVDWCKEAGCTAFDFVTKGILQEAIKLVEYNRLRDPEGKAPGVVGWWPERAVTFVENHDTGSSQGYVNLFFWHLFYCFTFI